LAFSSLFSHKVQLRATISCGALRTSSLVKASPAEADETRTATIGVDDDDDRSEKPWEALEKTQALLSEYRLAYRR
jgi:hypothetical protein